MTIVEVIAGSETSIRMGERSVADSLTAPLLHRLVEKDTASETALAHMSSRMQVLVC